MDPEENHEPIEEKKVEQKAKEISVRPAHFLADRRREYTIVVNVKDELEVWLMPTSEVLGDFNFKVSEAKLASMAKPYGFEKEIEEQLPSVEVLQRALWKRGIVTLDDLRNIPEVRNALGVLPSANAFVKYVVQGAK